MESNGYSCPNPGCSFTHRCEEGKASQGDLSELLVHLCRLYPNPKSFVRDHIDRMVVGLKQQNVAASHIMSQVRCTFRGDWANNEPVADPPSSPVADAGAEEPERAPDASFRLKRTLIFRDLEMFLQQKTLGLPGIFSPYLATSATGNPVVLEVFRGLTEEVHRAGNASKTFASLGGLLSRGSDAVILWKLYYSLSLFYRYPPSKGLIEQAFQKCTLSPVLHFLMNLAYAAMGDKALVLQLMMQSTVDQQQGKGLGASR